MIVDDTIFDAFFLPDRRSRASRVSKQVQCYLLKKLTVPKIVIRNCVRLTNVFIQYIIKSNKKLIPAIDTGLRQDLIGRNMNITELYHGLVTGNAKGVPSAAALFELVSGGIGPEEIKTNPLIAPLVSLIKTEADVFARSGITALPFSVYKLFDTTGNRLSYEGHYFERRRRLLTLSLASWLWKQEDHIAALEDTIWAICDEYSWCLPAHMANKSLGGMDVRRRLDLFACETGFAIAECLAMTGSLLNPAVSRRATDEVLYRIIESYMNSVTPQRWEMMDNNWCAVCAGSIAGTACYLIPDALQLAGILCRLAPTFDRYIASF